MPLLLACLALTVPQTATLVSRGETVEALLKEASTQYGTTLEAAPQTKNEIVIVSIHGATVNEFKQRLAAAIGAEWTTEANLARLVRPRALERAQEQEERKARILAAKDGIADLKEQIAKQGPFDANAAQALATKVGGLFTKYKGHLSDGQGLNAVIAMEPQSPAGRLAISAVAALSSEQIADVGPGERIVYSTQPTAMQRRFPGDISKSIQRYVAEQNLYVKALEKAATGKGWEDSWSPLLSRSVPDMPSALVLATARSPYNSSLTVDAMLVGADGQYVGHVRSLLNIDRPRSPEGRLKEGSIALSPRSQRFFDALQQLTKGKTFVEDKTLLEEMEYPEKNDPLSYVAADGLMGLADKENLIACVTDDGFAEPTFTAMDSDGKLNLGRFSDWLNGKCIVTHENGWIVATPRAPISVRESRADRAVMGPFFRRARQNGGASLGEIVELLPKLPSNYMQTLMPFMAFFLLPDLNSAIDDRNVELLRVLGRLSTQNRQAILAGTPIRFGQMDTATQADLNNLAFRADAPLSRSVSGAPSEAGTRESIKQEVTYAMPKGIPTEATYTVSFTENDAVIGDGGDNPAASYQPLSAWALGTMMVRAESADPTDRREQVRIEKYRYGHTRHYMLRLEMTPTISAHGDLHENSFPRNTPSVPYEQLPASFREAVEKAKADYRKQVGGGRGDGGKVPPPM